MATLKELEQRLQQIEAGNIKASVDGLAALEAKIDSLQQQIDQLKAAQDTQVLDTRIKEVVASVNSGEQVAVYSPQKLHVVPGIINALIDWEPIESANKYYVYYNALGANPIKIGPTTANSLTIPRLQAGTTYEAFVRSAAPGGYLSQPGAKIQFTTKTLN